jgi:hypothetical protein
MTARTHSGLPAFAGEVIVKSVLPPAEPSFEMKATVHVFDVAPPDWTPEWDPSYPVTVTRRNLAEPTFDTQADVLYHRPTTTKGQ